MLIGARDKDAFTPVQRRTYDLIASGPRRDVPYPFLAMLDAPGLADAIQAVGAAIRFDGALDAPAREVAIMAAAGAFGSGYEWDYHAAIARDLGMSEAVIAATLSGAVETIPEDRAACLVITLCRAAVREHRVPPDTLAELAALLGRTAASEVVAISGYYPLLALFLSAGGLDHPPPEMK
ncbi:MAG: hypothetical protein DI556_15355 [Rhodovulum sulfidophilum]|uniref:Carboxymuconolactone decarboxylase-like domain-containing protein n=1 Tax=Rhodovulum sulfidophilum TaxID=35806 RepID=A0A2W5NBT5_RHOSU|nr:MAG: hypothetical protein DI556_15355 [Rhodovulum sulfidophilum]